MRVAIENQLTPTDHGHLGLLLTYVSGLDAAFGVWISTQLANAGVGPAPHRPVRRFAFRR